MRNKITWAVGFFMVLGAACAGLDPVSHRDWESRHYDSPYEIVFQAVVSALEQRGHKVSQASKEEGRIETEPVEAKYKRMKISAEVRPLGKHTTEVRAKIELGEKGLFGGDYKPEPPKLTMYDDLFTEIELQVYREHVFTIEKRGRDRK